MGEAAALEKDGVEADLQVALAAAPEFCGEGFRLVRREWPTDIGPVDLMCRDAEDGWIAVEIKRVGTIDAVEQLARYLERIRLDPAMELLPRHPRGPGHQAAGADAGRGPRHRLRRRGPRGPARRARARPHAVRRLEAREQRQDDALDGGRRRAHDRLVAEAQREARDPARAAHAARQPATVVQPLAPRPCAPPSGTPPARRPASTSVRRCAWRPLVLRSSWRTPRPTTTGPSAGRRSRQVPSSFRRTTPSSTSQCSSSVGWKCSGRWPPSSSHDVTRRVVAVARELERDAVEGILDTCPCH